MDSMMNLPVDMFRHEFLPYLTLDDIVRLDEACISHEYRPKLLDTISGVILMGFKFIHHSMSKWLGMRQIFLAAMGICSDFFSSECNYVDHQFRYTSHLLIRNIYEFDKITDANIISICRYFTRLQSFHLFHCDKITDASIISISFHSIVTFDLLLLHYRCLYHINIYSLY